MRIEKPEVADSILNNVILFAPLYEKIVAEYKADLYIKGKLNVKRLNHLIKIVPSMFTLNKRVKEYLMESVNEMHYTAPSIYDMKVKAVSGTIPRFKGDPSAMLEYFNINIYSSSLLSDKILSPLAKNGRKHYSYLLDSVMEVDDKTIYKVLIVPKNKSTQLVSGYMTVNDQTWTVGEISIQGESEFVKFRLLIEMGQNEKEEFLPKKIDLDIDFRFLWNNLGGNYSAFYDYKSIQLDDIRKRDLPKADKYNLSGSFSLRRDSRSCITDSSLFAALRPIPLDTHEQQIYEDYFLRRDTLTYFSKKAPTRSRVFFGQVGDLLLSDYTVDLSRFGSVKCSPIINPLLFSYSHNNGLSYRQEFKYNQLFRGDRLLRIVPKIGYNFTKKEFYWKVNTDFHYWPKKRASIHLNFGNGNRIYNSDIMDDLKAIPDSVFNFNLLQLDYFRDFFFSLNHSVEVINGLTFSAG
ncbi:MAG: DUF5686 family protein, partial [Bacteroides sp.]